MDKVMTGCDCCKEDIGIYPVGQWIKVLHISII